MPARRSPSPVAGAAEKGYELETLFRQNRALEQQRAGSAMEQLMAGKQADLERQQQQQQFTTQDRETQGQGELGAINEFLRGNVPIARQMGRMERGLPTPEAGFPGEETYKPFDIPARGAGALAGLIKDRMPKAPEAAKPIVVGEGAKLFSPEGVQLGENPKKRMTMEEAVQAEKDLVAADKGKQGRTSIESDAEGGYRVKTHPTEPLGENLARWMVEMADPNTPPERKAVLADVIPKYLESQEKLAEFRARGTLTGGPLPVGTQESLAGRVNLINTLQGLSTIANSDQLDNFLKVGEQLKQFGLGYAEWLGGAKYGLQVDPQYAAFQTLVGQQLRDYFQVAGKQMTTQEKAVLDMSMPTMQMGPTMFRQRLNFALALARASMLSEQQLATTSRGKIDVEQLSKERSESTDRILRQMGFSGGLTAPVSGLPPSPPKSPAASKWEERLNKEGK